MSGYTPVFDSVFTGTLHGRWPDTGLWLCVLAMADKRGVLDVTPQYIASTTGLPLQEVIDCMARFCEPDPYSRTPDCEGRRLVLLETPRPWGWRIVNHAKYREKARLQAKDTARTDSGADAARKRHGPDAPPESPGVPRSPPKSPSQTQTQTQTHSGARARTRGTSADDPEVREQLRQRQAEELARVETEAVGAGFRTKLRHESVAGYRTAFQAWRQRQPAAGAAGAAP